MKKDIIKIEMTKEQQLWLLQRLKVDWDEEINYQGSNGECDTEYLERLYECYVAILGKPQGIIDLVVNNEIQENMLQEIKDLKEQCKGE